MGTMPPRRSCILAAALAGMVLGLLPGAASAQERPPRLEVWDLRLRPPRGATPPRISPPSPPAPPGPPPAAASGVWLGPLGGGAPARGGPPPGGGGGGRGRGGGGNNSQNNSLRGPGAPRAPPPGEIAPPGGRSRRTQTSRRGG